MPFEVLCCYIIRLMDKEVAQPFVVVYLHALTGTRNHVPYSLLRELYHTLDYRYKKNLQQVYIVHPTLWSRLQLPAYRGKFACSVELSISTSTFLQTNLMYLSS
ncbi:protein GDAP2-like [Tropilaelaps mercedesae]|uniref:Protein GDAP2-like n=1 Tax=Tropilaelaps mercedesae TaxID=418985 RepID=A0A1V9XB22_9ACAR|nr:protein GDAP2-like [Tropilaelaps mercedesae]